MCICVGSKVAFILLSHCRKRVPAVGGECAKAGTCTNLLQLLCQSFDVHLGRPDLWLGCHLGLHRSFSVALAVGL